MNSVITNTVGRIIRVFTDDEHAKSNDPSYWTVEYIGIEQDGVAKRKIIRLSPEEMDALVKAVLESLYPPMTVCRAESVSLKTEPEPEEGPVMCAYCRKNEATASICGSCWRRLG